MTSPHNCTVHHCVVAQGTTDKVGMGHLQPMGEQWPKLNLSESLPVNSDDFYKKYYKPKHPYLVRNAFEVPDVYKQDRILKRLAGSWPVIVEKQNRIIHDHREPFWVDWNFSKFLDAYQYSPIYLISPYIPDVMTTPHPKELDCDLLQRSLEESRIWMSAGNTSSSLHFDTHDVMIQQIDGVKEIFLWHPHSVPGTYQDFHTRYGLSPINVDKVDMLRFPEFVKHRPFMVSLVPGDMLYLPKLWWHQFRAPKGRNIMKTIQFEFEISVPHIATMSKTEAYLHAWSHTLTRSPYRCDAFPKGLARKRRYENT